MNARCTYRAASLLSLVLACGAAHANEAAMAKLTQCLALKAASAAQQACLDEVARLRQAQPPMSKSVQASTPAAAAPTDVKAPPAKFQTATAPPEVRKALDQYNVRIDGMDLQAAMMAVQASRSSALEAQLKEQLALVAKRNGDIATLNKLLADLRALRPAGENPEALGNLGPNQKAGREMHARLQAAGLAVPATGPDAVVEAGPGIYAAKKRTFDMWMSDIKDKIDASSSSQQMDMLRLQSLNNKRNEAFEIMTNFVKKMSDNRSSIIGNMR
jgi:hypothetical protein